MTLTFDLKRNRGHLLTMTNLLTKYEDCRLNDTQVIDPKPLNQQRAITPKIWCAELCFLCTALLLNMIYPPMKFQDDTWNNFWVMLRTKIMYENQRRAITPKIWWAKLCFLCTALLLNEIYLPMKFQDDTWNTFWVMLRTKIKYENQRRAITPKIWRAELWFLCTALLLNEIYPPMKSHDCTSHTFWVMLRTKCGLRTDGRTDRQVQNNIPPLLRRGA